MYYVLEGIEGSLKGMQFPIYLTVTKIGRSSSAGCQVVVKDDSVSREHAAVIMSKGRFSIRSVSPQNGTLLLYPDGSQLRIINGQTAKLVVSTIITVGINQSFIFKTTETNAGFAQMVGGQAQFANAFDRGRYTPSNEGLVMNGGYNMAAPVVQQQPKPVPTRTPQLPMLPIKLQPKPSPPIQDYTAMGLPPQQQYSLQPTPYKQQQLNQNLYASPVVQPKQLPARQPPVRPAQVAAPVYTSAPKQQTDYMAELDDLLGGPAVPAPRDPTAQFSSAATQDSDNSGVSVDSLLFPSDLMNPHMMQLDQELNYLVNKHMTAVPGAQLPADVTTAVQQQGTRMLKVVKGTKKGPVLLNYSFVYDTTVGDLRNTVASQLGRPAMNIALYKNGNVLLHPSKDVMYLKEVFTTLDDIAVVNT